MGLGFGLELRLWLGDSVSGLDLRLGLGLRSVLGLDEAEPTTAEDSRALARGQSALLHHRAVGGRAAAP